MAEFINYIIDSPIQPVKTNVLWVKKGVLHYYNKKWIPIAGGGSGNITYPIIDGEGNYSAVLAYSDNKALNISSIALGYNNISRNFAEAAFGRYNLSHESGDPSIATLFSIGNGSEEERKNAFEVKEDGEIYIGKRVESLQTILYNLENYFLNDKYDILEQQLSDLDTYTKSNIEVLKELIKADKLDLQNYKEYVEDGFLKMNTSITQTAEEIRLEASEIEERLDGKITEAESSFSITAEEIRAEVSRVETDLDGKITESNSLISQTADEIRTEVSRVELDINGSIRETNSRITQTAEEIKSEVYDIQTTLDGKINENSSKIEQTSEEIKSSVKLEQFNALTGAVDQSFTEVKQSIEGVTTTIGDRSGKTTSITEDIDGITTSLGTVEADIESLKKQSDGAIDTHFGKVTPTLDNEPAVNWDTEELKKEHTGDLYYNNTTGEAFRWSYDPETETYLWVELTDSALTDALDKISKLEVAIDGKVTIFYSEPSNYKEGDLWFVHIDYPSYHFIEGQILTAITAGDTFNASHWEDKTNFASHAEVTESVTQLNNYIDGAFSDNILTLAEIKQIKEAKKNFESLFSEVKESYSYLVISAVATDSDKTALRDAYNNLTNETNGSYTLLIATIDALIALDKEEGDDVLDIEVVEGLLAEYENAYELFSKDLTAYYAASAKLTEGIQNYLSSASDYIKDVMSDGVLSPIEKEQLLNIWRQIAEEFTANRGIAYNYKLLSINNVEEYIKRTDIYPEDSPYHSIYEAYENAYNVVKNIFTAVNEEGKNIWGFDDDDLSVSTDTPEDLTTAYISESLDAYYKALSPFAEMIAEITIAITDAHEVAKEYVSKLANHLDPKDNISVIGNGVILSTIIGVKSSTDDTFVSAINASNTNTDDLKLIDDTHGRIVYAGGIPSTNNWNDSTTVIYEDGHVKFKSGEISDSVSIGEIRQAILNKANTLQESLGVGGNTVIDGGLVLSTLLGVVDTEGELKAVLNASDISKDTVNNHGRIVFAGGIENSEDWTTAKTLIYEDGYIHFRWGEIDDGVEIGNALIKSVISGTIDLFSYPENGVLVPLFQVNKDDAGKIVSISSVYDFYVNGNLIVSGDTSSTAKGDAGVAGTLLGITVNGTTYKDENNDGIIDLGTITGGLTSVSWSDVQGRPTKVSEFLNDSGFITSAALVGYATQSWVEGKGYITGIDKSMVASAVGSSGNAGKVLSSTGGDLGWVSLPTSLPASDVYAWAKKSSLALADVPDLSSKYLSVNGGTINGASSSVTTPLAINTTYGHEVSVIDFNHKGVNRGGVGLYANGAWLAYGDGQRIGIRNDGKPVYALGYNQNGYELYHTGNFNPADYLPLSGGTIVSSGVSPLGLKTTRSSSPASYITIYGASGNVLGYMGYSYSSGMFLQHSEGNYIAVTSTDVVFNGNSLIHSGNIGSYKAGDADKLDGLDSSYFVGQHRDISQTLDANTVSQNHITHGSKWTNIPSTTIHSLLDLSYSSDWRAQLLFRPDRQRIHSRFYYNGTTWSDWKTIAFTDSNVASAQALTHSNGTIGVSVTSTGALQDKDGYQFFVCGSLSGQTFTRYQAFGSPSSAVAAVLEGGGAVSLKTNNIDRLFINSSGNVGIGTTNPAYKLDVAGTEEVLNVSNPTGGNVGIRFSRSTNTSWSMKVAGGNLYINENNSGTTRAVFYESSQGGSLALTGKLTAGDTVIDGSLGVTSTLTVSGLTTINGNLVVAGDTATGSDIRFKDRIAEHRIALESIAQAPLFTFKWNDREDKTEHLGTSAQYWEGVAPWLVKGTDFKALDYATLGVAIGISLANKTLNHEERIKILENKIEALETENRRLRYGN